MLLMMMHTMLVLVFLMDLALLLDLVWDLVLVLVWVLALDLVLMVLLMDLLLHLVYLRKAMALSAVDPSVEVTTVAKAEKVASAAITVVKAAREEVRVVVSNMAM